MPVERRRSWRRYRRMPDLFVIKLMPWLQRICALATCSLASIAVASDTLSEPLSALRRAHAERFDYVVDFRVATPMSPQTVELLQSRDGWWRVQNWYDDPASANRIPFGREGKLIVSADRVVRREERRLVGAVEQSGPTAVQFSRSEWIAPHAISDKRADIYRYPELLPLDAAKLRASGRSPHLDLWSQQSYSSLVDWVSEQLQAASDTLSFKDESGWTVTSDQQGVTAWIHADGSLSAARLELAGGTVHRIEFFGESAKTFFPARFPQEMRLLHEQVGGETLVPPEVAEIILFSEPKRADETTLKTLDPASIGLTVVPAGIQSHPAFDPSTGTINQSPRPPRWWMAAIVAGGLLAALGLLARFRRQNRDESASHLDT